MSRSDDAAKGVALLRASGGGNDFLVLVEPRQLPPPDTIRRWCTRGTSLGADGLFVVRRADAGIEMEHFNADGGSAELCLNGTRCAARLAFDLGWAERSVVVSTAAGTVEATDAGAHRVRLELDRPSEPPRRMELDCGGELWPGWFVTVGVPHFVVLWPEEMGSAPVATVGPRLRRHPDLGEAGANVDFVHFTSVRRMLIRTFERGVEAETLACGTGVLAAAAVGLELEASLPIIAMTLGGFELEVGATEEGWSLTGDARLVARVEALPGAELLPDPPAW